MQLERQKVPTKKSSTPKKKTNKNYASRANGP